MRPTLKLSCAILAGLMIVGCKKTDDSTATPPAASNTVSDQVNKATAGVQGAMSNAQSQMGSATDTAQAKLANVADLITQKKYDAADSALKEVEAMKGSLPQSMQDKITALRTQLDAAKATSGGGITLPSMGK